MPHPEDLNTPVEEQPETSAPDPSQGTPDAALPDDLADLGAELDQHRERVRDLEGQLLRRAAEFQNYRRRTQEDLAGAAERGRAEAVTALLDVLDDLRRSREAAEAAASQEAGGPRYESLKEGVDLVYRKFEAALAGLGVRRLEAVGQPFDENLHEALAQQPSEEHPSGTVVTEVQPGYALGDRILRHARVIVAQ
jgi:molecular chaperone GrpE